MRFPRGPRHCDRGRARRDPTGGERSVQPVAPPGRGRARTIREPGDLPEEHRISVAFSGAREVAARPPPRAGPAAPSRWEGEATGTEVFPWSPTVSSLSPAPSRLCSLPLLAAEPAPLPAAAPIAADVVVSAEAAPEPSISLGAAATVIDAAEIARSKSATRPRPPAHRARTGRRAVGRRRRRDVALPARHVVDADARPPRRRDAEQPVLRRDRPLGRSRRRTSSASRSCAARSRRSTARRRSAASCRSSRAGRRTRASSGHASFALGNAGGKEGLGELGFLEGVLSGTFGFRRTLSWGDRLERVLRGHLALGCADRAAFRGRHGGRRRPARQRPDGNSDRRRLPDAAALDFGRDDDRRDPSLFLTFKESLSRRLGALRARPAGVRRPRRPVLHVVDDGRAPRGGPRRRVGHVGRAPPRGRRRLRADAGHEREQLRRRARRRDVAHVRPLRGGPHRARGREARRHGRRALGRPQRVRRRRLSARDDRVARRCRR